MKRVGTVYVNLLITQNAYDLTTLLKRQVFFSGVLLKNIKCRFRYTTFDHNFKPNDTLCMQNVKV